MIKNLTWNAVVSQVEDMWSSLRKGLLPLKGVPVRIYGVPRGGIHIATLSQGFLERMGYGVNIVETPAEASFIVDDLIDSGATRKKFVDKYPSKTFLAAYVKNTDDWLSFPWERAGGEQTGAEDVFVRLLQFCGEDVTRGGLLETPARAAQAWKHYTSGYGQQPGDILKVFEDGAEKYDELVLVKNIPLYSHCEHHMAPIFGVAHVGYIAAGKIVGLSKLSRLVDLYARRLQVQERLTTQIADALDAHLKPRGVGVVLECRHMCMEARGVCQQGHTTVTSALRGVLKEKAEARAEFMSLCKGSGA